MRRAPLVFAAITVILGLALFVVFPPGGIFVLFVLGVPACIIAIAITAQPDNTKDLSEHYTQR